MSVPDLFFPIQPDTKLTPGTIIWARNISDGAGTLFTPEQWKRGIVQWSNRGKISVKYDDGSYYWGRQTILFTEEPEK